MRPAVRSIFLSDLHLGLTGCRAEEALAFLKATSSERLYLVGDILDLWIMRRRVRWSPVNNKLVRHVIKRAQRGHSVIYLPGNHDSDITALGGLELLNLRVARQVIHHALDGRRFLVTHGDEADAVVQVHPMLARAGAHAYDALIWINAVSNRVRAAFGRGPWSFSRAVKAGVKRATMYVSNYEQVLIERARAVGAHGVICGHVHQPAMHDRHGLLYLNCGDWIEHCTAIVERWDGSFEIVTWTGAFSSSDESDEPGDADLDVSPALVASARLEPPDPWMPQDH
jgi:UDP-2,3-diacylglucosamine pyrophosphatase LpxH